MKTISHALGCIGFFDALEVEKFLQQLGELLQGKNDFFSLGARPEYTSVVKFHWEINTSDVAISDASNESGFLTFAQELRTQPWESVKIEIQHGLRTKQPIELILSAAYNGEFFSALLNREDGSCDVSALLKDKSSTEKFLKGFLAAVNLSSRPQKYSREIPQSLETQLLCDSMHLCNVCRHEGVIIHHINPVEESGKTEETNLIVLCLTHHRQAHTKSLLSRNLKPEHLHEYKLRHAEWVRQQGLEAAQPIS